MKCQMMFFHKFFLGELAVKLAPLFGDTDTETFIIATHGIMKKSQKTPAKEIEKAEAIRKEYFKNK